MGGRGHGAGVTGLDRVCHAVQGEDLSRALKLALKPVNPRTTEKKIPVCLVLLHSQWKSSAHTPSWHFGSKTKKPNSVVLSFLFLFFKSILPSKDFFQEFDELAVQPKLRLVLRSE